MSKLEDNGPKAVAEWHKNINVFQKKLIFIPMHADSHWLICVIVNTGLIGNKPSDDEHALEVVQADFVHQTFHSHFSVTMQHFVLGFNDKECSPAFLLYIIHSQVAQFCLGRSSMC